MKLPSIKFNLINSILAILVVVIIGIFLGLIYAILMIPYTLLIGLLSVLYYKKNKVNVYKSIPQDILDDYHKAERRFIESNGDTEATQILWDISRERQSGFTRDIATQSGIGNPIVSEQFAGRQDIPSNAVTGIASDTSSNTGTKRNNHKRLFRRR